MVPGSTRNWIAVNAAQTMHPQENETNNYNNSTLNEVG
jgi:hypothetical protein